jgi:hypothetical protein
MSDRRFDEDRFVTPRAKNAKTVLKTELYTLRIPGLLTTDDDAEIVAHVAALGADVKTSRNKGTTASGRISKRGTLDLSPKDAAAFLLAVAAGKEEELPGDETIPDPIKDRIDGNLSVPTGNGTTV